MVYMEPQLEKVKAYAKHTLTDQLAQRNLIVCLEALEEECELNQYKNEKTWKGKPVSGQASSKGATEERLGLELQAIFWSAIYW